MRTAVIVGTVVSGLLVSGCGDSSPPKPANETVSGTVAGIKVHTRRSKLFGEVSRYYNMELQADDGKKWFISFGAGNYREEDLSNVIGGRVVVTCYREQAPTTCSGRSVSQNGRELPRQSKL